MFKKILFLLAACLFSNVNCKIQCVDQNNKPVDWYVVFKHPKIEETQGLLSSGESFMYMTSETLDQGWTWSSVGIQDRNTLLANTLIPYYANSDDGFWILYNDEVPSLNSYHHRLFSGGHTKGIVGADNEGGIWLVHSVPKYPPPSDQGYGYPHTGLMYGQSALCMSLTPESINTIGKALSYNDPDIYGQRMQSELLDLYPDLVDAAKKVNNTKYPWYFKEEIKTVGGATFTAFAKAKLFGKDLYDLVATELQSDLLVETWQNEEDPLPSICYTPFQVLNIKGIKITDRDIFYRSSKDHSKWAIGAHELWTCIGDINRAGPQEKRGGGTVCLNNKQLWTQYHYAIDRIEDCKSKYRHHKSRWWKNY